MSGEEFFRRLGFIRQLTAEIPDLEHFGVLESVARVDLYPALEILADSRQTIVIVQTHAPIGGLHRDVFVHCVEVGRGHLTRVTKKSVKPMPTDFFNGEYSAFEKR